MIRKSILGILAFSFLFTACDEVEFPFEGQVDSACEGLDSPFFEGNQTLDPEQQKATRRVLIMDFTGHRCAGCPAAALEANNIATDYEGEVFVLGVHPDIPSLTAPAESAEEPGDAYFTEWRTPEGTNYESIYDIPGALPLGVVSGKSANGNFWLQWASWRSTTEPLLVEDRLIEVELELDYNESTRGLQASGEVSFLAPSDGTYSLILAVVENNIVDWQKNGSSGAPSDPNFPGGDIPNYVHKHVLRKHINGLGGTELNTGTPAIQGDVYSYCEAGIIDQEFNIDEVSIYAFVYDISTLEILDVIEKKIIE
ncbi:MAG: Omp28-related outer membrane protein [Flavobacteriales bacterium]